MCIWKLALVHLVFNIRMDLPSWISLCSGLNLWLVLPLVKSVPLDWHSLLLRGGEQDRRCICLSGNLHLDLRLLNVEMSELEHMLSGGVLD